MRVALIADAYPPMRTSGAVQMRDLAEEFASQGHEVTVIVPSMGRSKRWAVETSGGVQVLRLAALPTKDTGYFRRTINETLLSFAMWLGLRKSPLRSCRWEAAVWYSPSIFLAPLVGSLRRSTNCRSYLILRDIFPEWAVDMGLLRRGLAYRFFKLMEKYQYSVADTIGVQSKSNLPYLSEWRKKKPNRRLEVLDNWLVPTPNIGCKITVADTLISGRTIFVYAGNMGVAQGMDAILDLAERLKNRRDIGFLFVGRGSEVLRLMAAAAAHALDNVVFFEELEPREIPGLLAQCHVGIVALDPRHKTHNVPGKFVAYMHAGLPVLARINAGNDLADLIENEFVGRVCVGESLEQLQSLAEQLCEGNAIRSLMSTNARNLAQRLFSAASAVKQIEGALEKR
jgi:glycosyltransferase involved in cell wall biosynthesis